MGIEKVSTDNCTKNMTQGVEKDVLYKIYYTLAISVIAAICLCGNALVIRCITTYKNLQIANNYLILSLAFSDTLQGVIFPAYNFIHIYEELNADEACKWVVFLVCFPQLTSAYNLVGLTVMRLYAVHSPLKYYTLRSKRKLYTFIGLIWFWCFMLALLLYVVWWVDENATVYECRYELHYSSLHAAAGLIAFSCVIPAVTMITMYAAIVCIYRKHKKELLKLMKGSCSNILNNDRISKEFRLAQTAGIMIGFFLVTWLPIYIYIYLFTWCRCHPNECDKRDNPWLRATLRIICFFNAAVNVFIYAGRNPEIRLAFKKELKKLYDCLVRPFAKFGACRVTCLCQSKVQSVVSCTPPMENEDPSPHKSEDVSDLFTAGASISGVPRDLMAHFQQPGGMKQRRASQAVRTSERGRSHSVPMSQPYNMKSLVKEYRVELSIQSINPICTGRIKERRSTIDSEPSDTSVKIKMFPYENRNCVFDECLSAGNGQCETCGSLSSHGESVTTKL